MAPPDYTKPEAQTREAIDKKLELAGWAIQDKNRINLYEKLGVAVRDKFAGQQIWTALGCPKGKRKPGRVREQNLLIFEPAYIRNNCSLVRMALT